MSRLLPPALRGLTSRGRAFLAAGVTALACGIVLGSDELLKIGALLVVLPLLSAAVVGRRRHRLALRRAVEPARVAAGMPASVRLTLSNESSRSTGLLLLEEHVPYTLGARPRFVLDRMGGRWRRELRYEVRTEVRGRYHLGPLTVRVGDPFGLVELDRTFTSQSTVVVTPRVAALPAIPLTGSWTGSGDNRPRDFAGGSAEDVTVREYRHGDELRRVHWRASAHAGELMVRREEQPWQSRATLFLDNRHRSHRGTGPASSLEHAVALTASIAVHLSRRGFAVRLVTASATEEHGWHAHGTSDAESGPLLESLAVLRPSDRALIETSWLTSGDSRPGGLTVAVLGSLLPDDLPVLRRLQRASGTSAALVLDVERWAGAGAPSVPAVAELAAQGWRSVPVDPADPPARTWERLGLQQTGWRPASNREVVG